MNDTPRQPGDTLLDRYFSSSDGETRERARERFYRLADILLKVAIRQTEEDFAAARAARSDGRLILTGPPHDV